LRSAENALRRESLTGVEFSAAEWGSLVRERDLRQLTITMICRYASVAIPPILAEADGLTMGTRIILDYQDMMRHGIPAVTTVLTANGAEESDTLTNTLGEFDVVADWWKQKLCEMQGVENVLVKSIDTDLIVICTLLHRPGDKHCVETTFKKKPCFFDIAVFHTWLQTQGYKLEVTIDAHT
jgi:hypothetical protein